MPNWSKKVDAAISAISSANAKAYARANHAAVKRAMQGQGPDSLKKVPGLGVREVYCIPSEHVPEFCRSGYKNGYDLGKLKPIGKSAPAGPKTRELVDDALPVLKPEKTYFGAATLYGAGVRFYGDICLVIKPDQTPADTVVLDRNSYDLVREPLSNKIHNDADRKKEANRLSGDFSDLADMTMLMLLEFYGERTRRLSSGQISEVMLHDEDYIEVLRQSSFTTDQCEEARISSPEATKVSSIIQARRLGPPPSLPEVTYAAQRISAQKALQAKSVKTRVVGPAGRVR